MPNAYAASGIINPNNLSAHPIRDIRMNHGTTVTVDGTIIVASMNKNKTFFPGKENLANENPARAQKKVVRTTLEQATMMLLMYDRTNEAICDIRPRFGMKDVPGTSLGGQLNIWPKSSVLATIIQ